MRRLIIGGCPLEFPDEPELKPKMITGVDVAAAGEDRSVITQVDYSGRIQKTFPHKGILIARYYHGRVYALHDDLELISKNLYKHPYPFRLFTLNIQLPGQLAPLLRRFYIDTYDFLPGHTSANELLFLFAYFGDNHEIVNIKHLSPGTLSMVETREIFFV